MAISLPQFSAEDWARTRRTWTNWWDGELERALVVIEQTPWGQHPGAPDFLSSLPPDLPPAAAIDRYQARIQHTRWHGDAFPKLWINFGPGILAGFLGCRVEPQPDTVWFWPANDQPIEAIRPVYDDCNPWWQRICALTAEASARWAGQVVVGHTDLGGNLDVIASLRGAQGLAYDLLDQPEEVERVARTVTALWLRYYDTLYDMIAPAGMGTTPWAPVWSPGRTYMLQCDYSYMISPAMFERFVLPDLTTCCDHLDHGFYHLDGKGELPHLDMLLSMPRLRGIQWIPGDGAPPPEQWLPLLKRIRDAGKLCQLGVTAEGALAIVRALGGKGFCLQVWDVDGDEQINAFLKEMARY